MKYFLLSSRIVILSITLWCTGCFRPERVSRDNETPAELKEDEKVIALMTADMLKDLENGGVFWEDPWANALFASQSARLKLSQLPQPPHIRLVRNPIPNAFAMYDGTLCVHTGLIASLTDADQLAFVLGHESTHWKNRHSLYEYRGALRAITTAETLQTVTLPVTAYYGYGWAVDLSTSLTAAVAVQGYGRDLEREADAEGLQRLKDGGFDIARAVDLFHLFLTWGEKYNKGFHFTFMANHPSNEERLKKTETFLERYGVAIPTDVKVDPQFIKASRHIRLANAEWNRRAGRYFASLEDLDLVAAYDHESKGMSLERAENYRAMIFDFRKTKDSVSTDFWTSRYGEKTDTQVKKEWFERAKRGYEEARSEEPLARAASRGEGLLMLDDDEGEAQILLKSYLSSKPVPSDKLYIEEILAKHAQ